MTSKFETENLQKKVSESLDKANQELGAQQLSDISNARMIAMRAARSQEHSRSGIALLNLQWWKNNNHFTTPVAVAVILAVLVSYNQIETVPAIPAELMLGEVPTEELALLEDLEFASWLAEQEQMDVL